MRLEQTENETKLALTADELHLLRRALERASFIDTPVEEQADIAAFCNRALATLRTQTT